MKSLSLHYTECLKSYYSKIDEYRLEFPDDLNNSVFELNAEMHPYYCGKVLDGSAFDKCEPVRYLFLKLGGSFFKELGKLLVIKVLFRLFSYSDHSKDSNDYCSVIFTYADARSGQLDQKDFHPAEITSSLGKRFTLCTIKLPTISLWDYIRIKRQGQEKIEQYYSFKVLVNYFIKSYLALRVLQKKSIMDTYFGQMYVHDLISGHGAFGFQTAKAISKVVREFSIKNCIFPFECQDWICGAMTEIDYIDRKISVEFWQNGLRAYGSLSLYLTQKNPLYKANQPTKIKAINQSWSTFFLDIGYESHVDIMKNHRFDHAKICVQRKSVPKKIVYLAGISEDQTERDLKLLTENFQEYRLHVKFHPSHPEDFKAKFDVFHVYDLSSDSYTVLFYGNTAMVYEVDFPAHLMFYLNDVRVPNLDPLLACSLGKDTFLDLLSDGLQMSYIKQSIAKDTV